MIRVVLDTNIIVSALLQPLGPPAEVFLMALGGTVELCMSNGIFAEYEEVIRRPRFRRTEEVVLSTLDAIRAKARWVRPFEPVRACADPDDDIFLECCQASGAAFLITGNVKDFPIRWLGTAVVRPRQFLEIMTDAAR